MNDDSKRADAETAGATRLPSDPPRNPHGGVPYRHSWEFRDFDPPSQNRSDPNLPNPPFPNASFGENGFPRYRDPFPQRRHGGPFRSDSSPNEPSRRKAPSWERPLLFYVLTWLSTTWVGTFYSNGPFWTGLWFSVPLMIILSCHEMGHFIQARRYKVHSTWPYFIPVPFPPFGTFGAVIQMDSRIPNIRALFDIGISGPLAGLIPTMIFMAIGIPLSSVETITPSADALFFGEPFLFRWVSEIFFDRSLPGTDLVLHPIGMAAWTGLFITSLNLIPLGQLDGGHVFYALLKRRAALGSSTLYYGIILFIVLAGRWEWAVMVLILSLIGIRHPPTANDFIPLGKFRTLLGWLTLAFIVIGFTPNPISEMEVPEVKRKPVYSYRTEPQNRQEIFYEDHQNRDAIEFTRPLASESGS